MSQVGVTAEETSPDILQLGGLRQDYLSLVYFISLPSISIDFLYFYGVGGVVTQDVYESNVTACVKDYTIVVYVNLTKNNDLSSKLIVWPHRIAWVYF